MFCYLTCLFRELIEGSEYHLAALLPVDGTFWQCRKWSVAIIIVERIQLEESGLDPIVTTDNIISVCYCANKSIHCVVSDLVIKIH